MADIIKLLPDGVINQIAAGEVIQRPSSVVKELIDNAIDSGATQIHLLIRDAGKSLIQISDNGCGMSPTDARMAFERHATSKILSADDLFKVQTKGFRGEALASVASVAQVELKTKLHQHTTGTRILISDSKVRSQEPCACSDGTQIMVKNLFFNVPARRKFLKSDSVEARHIQDEFINQALSHPEISFIFQHNDNVIYRLNSGNLKQRILGIFGKKYEDQLLPVSPQTDVVEISGFIGKPDIAKKSRGEQFFFVNRRAVKSPYLAHAVLTAYDQILAPDVHPFYTLYLHIDPEKIDINVHPTKHEIKFEDERLIYHFLKAAVRYSLGQFSLTPQIDFEAVNPGIERLVSGMQPTNPFKTESTTGTTVRWDALAFTKDQTGYHQGIEVPDLKSRPLNERVNEQIEIPVQEQVKSFKAHQFLSSYIVVQLKSEISIIDQQLASERILYEYYKALLKSQEHQVQRLLFPQNLHLNHTDALLLNEILESLTKIGFEMENFGSDSFVIHGIPAILEGRFSENELIIDLIDKYKQNLEFEIPLEDNIARSLASGSCIKRNQELQSEEIYSLVEQLFLCEIPFSSPSGKACIFHLSTDELQKKFS